MSRNDHYHGRINHRERGTGEQIFDILSALRKGPLLFTHIMYKANLNGTLQKDLLGYLTNESYVEFLPDKTIRLTSKGYTTLKAISPFFNFIGRIREIRRRHREVYAC